MTAIASLISAIMLGSFASLIPGFNPVSMLYNYLFGEPLPEYLYDGFSAIGQFSLLYSFVAVLISPFYCRLDLALTFDRPSKEDLVYIPLMYLVYVYVVNVKGLLTIDSALVGIVAVTLPVAYRLIVYLLDSRLERYKSSCYYQLGLFLLSLAVCVPVTIVYLAVVHAILNAV